MLAFTPDVESALRWFDHTHELATDEGRLRWRRIAMPAAGGAGDQDRWLSEALDLLKRVHDDLVTPKPKRTNEPNG